MQPRTGQPLPDHATAQPGRPTPPTRTQSHPQTCYHRTAPAVQTAIAANPAKIAQAAADNTPRAHMMPVQRPSVSLKTSIQPYQRKSPPKSEGFEITLRPLGRYPRRVRYRYPAPVWVCAGHGACGRGVLVFPLGFPPDQIPHLRIHP